MSTRDNPNDLFSELDVLYLCRDLITYATIQWAANVLADAPEPICITSVKIDYAGATAEDRRAIAQGIYDTLVDSAMKVPEWDDGGAPRIALDNSGPVPIVSIEKAFDLPKGGE